MVVDRRERRVDVDPLALEVGRQPVLLHEVDALDLSLGLGGVREHERNVVELQSPAQLGEFSVLAPEEPRLVHIDLQWQPVVCSRVTAASTGLDLNKVAGAVLLQQRQRNIAASKFRQRVRERLAHKRRRIALLRDMPQQERLQARRIRL